MGQRGSNPLQERSRLPIVIRSAAPPLGDWIRKSLGCLGPVWGPYSSRFPGAWLFGCQTRLLSVRRLSTLNRHEGFTYLLAREDAVEDGGPPRRVRWRRAATYVVSGDRFLTTFP